MKYKILLVEDEQKLSKAIVKYLMAEGYASAEAFNGRDALDLYHRFHPDLIVLDIMLPDMDGFQVCQTLRQTSDVPILFLTARIDDIDRLTGFALGADDYVAKPFNPQELMARIKAILKRAAPPPISADLQVGALILMPSRRQVFLNSVEVVLTQVEFDILAVLIKNPEQVFSRQALLIAARGIYTEYYERTIDSHIKNLRKKINLNAGDGFIKTLYGVGYKLL